MHGVSRGRDRSARSLTPEVDGNSPQLPARPRAVAVVLAPAPARSSAPRGLPELTPRRQGLPLPGRLQLITTERENLQRAERSAVCTIIPALPHRLLLLPAPARVGYGVRVIKGERL